MYIRELLQLLRMSDSAFPVGTFSFSNGLETAAHIGIVHDASTLEQYVATAASQSAFCDAVAALHAFRAVKADDYDALRRADDTLMRYKMNDEARLMLKRMGKKLAELAVNLFPEHEIPERLLSDITAGTAQGAYPIVQGMAFACAGLDEEQLFASHQYGVVNMILSAALRCVRVSHLDTQAILSRMIQIVEEQYVKAKDMALENMHSFVPGMDILASMHEKGAMRLFMS